MQQPDGDDVQVERRALNQPEASDEEFTDVVDGSSSSGASSEEDDEDEEQPRPRGAPPKAAGADFESWPQLVAVAKAHMQSGKFEKAVNEYSDLLKRSSLAGGTGGDPTARARHAALLLARSAAFAALSRQLRGIPAAQSERRAIFAPDPCQLAALGLKDAEAAAALQDGCPEAQLHRGDCLALLERYTAAEAAYKTGLGYQPTHEALQRQLAQLRALLDGGSTKEGDTGDGRGGGEARQQGAGRSVRDAAEDAECTLCFKLYYEPVTTPCGHTFCKACFSRAQDHSNRCPMCRTVLHVGRELPVTIALKTLLEKSFPDEYAERRQEEAEAAAAVPEADAPLPLFIMSLLLPGEHMALNIFEPRYRLMVRRCMEGSRRFGMGTVTRNHELCEVACEVEIVECQPLPDGRFYLEVQGRRRFSIADSWEQDGYRMARPAFFSDEAPEPDSPEAAALAQAAGEVEALADAFVERLRGLAQTRRGLNELLHRAGDKPSGGNPEALSFWVANLVTLALSGGDAGLKRQFMETRNTRDRLQAERELLQQLSSLPSSGCTLM